MADQVRHDGKVGINVAWYNWTIQTRRCKDSPVRYFRKRRQTMAWTRPVLREICIGMEINGYLAGKM